MSRPTTKLAAEKGFKVIVHGRTDSEALDKIHGETPGSVKTFFDIADQNFYQQRQKYAKTPQAAGDARAVVPFSGIIGS